MDGDSSRHEHHRGSLEWLRITAFGDAIRDSFLEGRTIATADLAIKQVVRLMTENHSLDQMLGSLQDHCPDLEGINIDSPSARFNIGSSGNDAWRFGFRPLDSPVALAIQAVN